MVKFPSSAACMVEFKYLNVVTYNILPCQRSFVKLSLFLSLTSSLSLSLSCDTRSDNVWQLPASCSWYSLFLALAFSPRSGSLAFSKSWMAFSSRSMSSCRAASTSFRRESGSSVVCRIQAWCSLLLAWCSLCLTLAPCHLTLATCPLILAPCHLTLASCTSL